MNIITIVIPPKGEVGPPTVYIGDLDPRVAAFHCDQATQSLAEEWEGMVVDRTLPTDWTP